MTIYSLTPSKVLTAKKRKKPYIIRDQKLKGFHLKIYPSGRKTFAITCRRGGKQYNERIGDAAVMTVADARRIAANRLTVLNLTTKTFQIGVSPSTSLMEVSFSAVADAVFSRYER
ncbi:MAG: Arm DNA-binding domain-containing protein, partial [Candidatus Puniceispirillales bacterium WSBS_2018_MAG_OTU23]